MAHCNTILSQILKFVPRHEFEILANEHHSGRSFRKASRWSQFVTLSLAQLPGRSSLRDIVENMSAQSHRIYHLGCAKLSRSNLSRMNESKSYALYEALFGRLLSRCQCKAPNHDFRFKNALYSLDASTIDLIAVKGRFTKSNQFLSPLRHKSVRALLTHTAPTVLANPYRTLSLENFHS